MTRAELLARITTSEFLEWRVLEELEPFGERGDYLRAGIIASAVVNSNPYRDRNQPAAKPSDFIPNCEEEEDQSADQIFSMMQMLMEVQNARVGEVVLEPQ